MNKEQFIEQSNKKFDHKFDHSKVKFLDDKTYVVIICPIHGETYQKPNVHLLSMCGCQKCGKAQEILKRSLTTEKFIERSRLKHGYTYDYSQSICVDSSTPLTVVCKKHGPFYPKPNNHMNGAGCRKCYYERRSHEMTQDADSFIEKSVQQYGNLYVYTKVIYIDSSTKVTIICRKHGEFESTPNKHLRGSGCPSCSKEKSIKKQRLSLRDFLLRASSRHGTKYDYSKISSYVDMNTPITIVCPIHGDTIQRPAQHLLYCGCPKCGITTKLTLEDFIERSKKIHGNRYSYAEADLVSRRKKVIIICQKHGPFKQTPMDHMSGCGCQSCVSDGFNHSYPAYFYVLFIKPLKSDSKLLSFIGYGISNNINVRLRTHRKNLKETGYEIVKKLLYRYEKGKDALAFENYVKKKFSPNHVRINVPGFVRESIDMSFKRVFIKFLDNHMDD